MTATRVHRLMNKMVPQCWSRLQHRVLGLGALILVALLAASTALADESAKRLLALIDYIDSDYKNAVQAGKILNASEFQEQLEFS